MWYVTCTEQVLHGKLYHVKNWCYVVCYMYGAGVTWQVISCKELVLCGMLHVQSRCDMASYIM